jgi:2,3-bisphosphoglycerate-independent phosphoglycerate mutase
MRTYEALSSVVDDGDGVTSVLDSVETSVRGPSLVKATGVVKGVASAVGVDVVAALVCEGRTEREEGRKGQPAKGKWKKREATYR